MIFRPLTIAEFESVSALAGKLPPSWVNTFMVRTVLLAATPDKESLFTTAPAAYVDILAEAVLKSSELYGEVDFKKCVEEARKQLDWAHVGMIAFIMKAFPHKNLHELRAMTFRDLLQLFVVAETLLGQIELAPAKPPKDKKKMTPEELARWRRQAQRKFQRMQQEAAPQVRREVIR